MNKLKINSFKIKIIAKNLSDLIGKKKELKGDLTIDTLIVSQKHNFKIKVLGDSNFKMCKWIWKRED